MDFWSAWFTVFIYRVCGELWLATLGLRLIACLQLSFSRPYVIVHLDAVALLRRCIG